MRPNPCKVRIYWPSPWLTNPRFSRRLTLSEESRKFISEHNLGDYRVQSHDGFVTVIFENPQSAVWFNLINGG